MKNILFLFIFCTAAITAKAQKTPCLQDLGNGNCLVKEGEHFGVMKKAKFIVPAFFDSIIPVGKDYFIVKQNGLYGLFSKTGKMEVPVSYQKIVVVDSKAEMFELIGSGNRSLYISSPLSKLRDYQPVNAGLFASRFEISVMDYLTMVQWQMDESPLPEIDWKSLLPDTNKMEPKTKRCISHFYHQNDNGMAFTQTYTWAGASGKIYVYFSPFMKNDLNTQKALNYPVSGITHEQATIFCQLLSMYFTNEINPFSNHSLALRFRLPTVGEWEEFASVGLPNETMKKNGRLDSLNDKGCQLFHYNFSFSCASVESFLKERGEGMAYVSDYFPNHLGLNNVFGNAAEMVREKGIAKGGSIAHYAIKASVDQYLEYQQAQPWLGFRPVAEIYLIE